MTIKVNERCPLRCAHCSLGFSDSYSGDYAKTLSEAQLRNLVRSVDADVYEMVAFAGGEPSLSPNLVQIGISECRKKSLQSAMISAPVWAKTPGSAERLLDALPGLNVLFSSYDTYHLKFLTFEHYRNATIAAFTRDITSHFLITSETDAEADRLEESLRPIRFLIAGVGRSRTVMVGNASDHTVGRTQIRQWQDIEKLPRTCILGNALIDRDFGVHGCCFSAEAPTSPFSIRAQPDSKSLLQAQKELEGRSSFQAVLRNGFIDALDERGRAEVTRLSQGREFCVECDLCIWTMRLASEELWNRCVVLAEGGK